MQQGIEADRTAALYADADASRVASERTKVNSQEHLATTANAPRIAVSTCSSDSAPPGGQASSLTFGFQDVPSSGR